MGEEAVEFGRNYVVPVALYIKIVLFLVVALSGAYFGLLFLKKRNFGGVASKQIVRESVESVGHGLFVVVVSVEGTRFAVFKSKDNIAVKRLPERNSTPLHGPPE